MPTQMKSLRSGNFGDGATKVRAGREFTVSDMERAKELETNGDAVILGGSPAPAPEYKSDTPPENKMEDAAPANKMEGALENKAAAEGPFVSHGGETGAEEQPSSSPVARRPARRKSPSSRKRKSQP